ncbi:MAG: inorganic phosphate transporter [Acidobacteria bacterium]|nr:inorganic phosphate transporter [Acidobacteriota bacterium]
MDASVLLILIVVVALLFEFANGWNDAANSIATIVSTRVLKPLPAVAWAAFWNFVAAFTFGTAVAKTIGTKMINLDMINGWVLLTGLLGAIIWTGVCTWMGLPISVSHSLIGGYAGAAIAHAGFGALILGGWVKPVLGIFLAPFIGMFGSILVTIVTSWIVYRQAPQKIDRWFRRLQLVSAAAFSLGHGTNDAQKGMGIITAALVTSGAVTVYEVPFWVIITCHLAIAAGTLGGGWRVIKTMGQNITKLTPFGGFAAESAAALTLFGTAATGIPASTTHTVTGSIIGVGASRRLTAVRWGITRPIFIAWALTMPGAAALGALLYWLIGR